MSLMKADHPTGWLGHGSKAVTTAGTDVPLTTTNTPIKWICIQARTTNTSYIAVGASGVDATLGSGSGILLAAGDSVILPVDNLTDVYIDSLVNGEGVRYTYGQGF